LVNPLKNVLFVYMVRNFPHHSTISRSTKKKKIINWNDISFYVSVNKMPTLVPGHTA